MTERYVEPQPESDLAVRATEALAAGVALLTTLQEAAVKAAEATERFAASSPRLVSSSGDARRVAVVAHLRAFEDSRTRREGGEPRRCCDVVPALLRLLCGGCVVEPAASAAAAVAAHALVAFVWQPTLGDAATRTPHEAELSCDVRLGALDATAPLVERIVELLLSAPTYRLPQGSRLRSVLRGWSAGHLGVPRLCLRCRLRSPVDSTINLRQPRFATEHVPVS